MKNVEYDRDVSQVLHPFCESEYILVIGIYLPNLNVYYLSEFHKGANFHVRLTGESDNFMASLTMYFSPANNQQIQLR